MNHAPTGSPGFASDLPLARAAAPLGPALAAEERVELAGAGNPRHDFLTFPGRRGWLVGAGPARARRPVPARGPAGEVVLGDAGAAAGGGLFGGGAAGARDLPVVLLGGEEAVAGVADDREAG